jgi:NAD(P)-dependent dehydrogenase (short-subunit alcohol dehydrogenase family)
MGKVQGKVAVVTGGTQGIGLATAKLFASEGAYFFITGRRQKELEEAVPIGSNVTGVQGDVANLADLDHLYESVKTKGRIDVLFADVGLGGFVPLGSITEEYYDKTFDTNVKGLLFPVQKALALLNDGASIILTVQPRPPKGRPASASTPRARRPFVHSCVPGPQNSRTGASAQTFSALDCRYGADGDAGAGSHRAHRVHRPDGPQLRSLKRSPRSRSFWARMTPVSSRVSNSSPTAAERKCDCR